MKYFSLFSGIGGFEFGFPNSWKCVGYSEIDKYADCVYRRHFPTHKGYGDARVIDPNKIPYFDLLCAGFPCPSFSVAGKQGGLQDSRGALFFEIARILSNKKPRYFLLENVKGILSHDTGKTYAKILGILANIGYLVQWEVINSNQFGVPQNRERIFIIGHLRGIPRPEVFPIRESYGSTHTAKPIRNLCAGTLSTKNQNGQAQLDRSTTLVWTALTETRTEQAKEIRRESLKDGRDFCPRRGKELVKRTDELMNCVTGGKNEMLIILKDEIRRLTPIECERLQAFPDDYTAWGVYQNNKRVELSDTQRYKMLGNAVTTTVITAISQRFPARIHHHFKEFSYHPRKEI